MPQTKKILICHETPEIREIFKNTLEMKHNLVLVDSARGAWDILSNLKDISTVFWDVGIPIEAFHGSLKEKIPGAKIVLLMGSKNVRVCEKDCDSSISKPYLEEKIIKAITS
jgi:DNA-binding NtrC family response regulator